ncbi:MAG: Fic family protein [Patescibacteria group bacterium]|nr:Fic family protein [Patescibacteria group bacterium]
MFKPKYTLTNSIVRKLTVIAEARSVITRAKILPRQELRLRRQARIRMTHSSTAIEGNMLNLQQVEALSIRRTVDAPERDIHEVENYLQAMRYIEQVVAIKRPLTEKVFLRIHALVTANTLPGKQSGKYRTRPVYVIRRRVGSPPQVMYTAPDAKRVRGLVQDLLAWVGQASHAEVHPVITAGIIHQEIAAIHPFADGNGRTARAIATLVLYQRGYDFRKLFMLEDFYNTNRPAYYAAINTGATYDERRVELTPWLEYFVNGFAVEIQNLQRLVQNLAVRKVDTKGRQQQSLGHDQLSILDFLDTNQRITVKDVVDILRCPRRTAQLHLQRLKQLGTIKQVGKGPASAYILA